jgi:hypothetical protein
MQHHPQCLDDEDPTSTKLRAHPYSKISYSTDTMTLSKALELLRGDVAFSIFLGVIFSYIVGRTFYNWYRLRHIKGPWLASVSKSWLIWRTLAGNFHQDFSDVCEKYGMSSS